MLYRRADTAGGTYFFIANLADRRSDLLGFIAFSLPSLLQVTANSVTGLFGIASQQCALRLIEQNLVTILASDAHNVHKRQLTLRPALAYS